MMYSWSGCMGGSFGMGGWVPVFLLVGLVIAVLLILLIERGDAEKMFGAQ